MKRIGQSEAVKSHRPTSRETSPNFGIRFVSSRKSHFSTTSRSQRNRPGHESV